MNIDGKSVKKILVTGGAGFIGANFIRHVHRRFPDLEVVNFDKLTYAGNLENLAGIESRYTFLRGDIRDADAMRSALAGVDTVVNFAAETHVDRSIHEPGEFILTNVYGVFVLLEQVRKSGQVRRVIHVSTDEVYGSIREGAFGETSPLNPSSPYAASKAGGDRLAYSYFKTYGLSVIIVRPANNYGPYQYPEKLIPFFITRALADRSLSLYGDGCQCRDWLYVEDTSRAIVTLLESGTCGEVYNVSAGQEQSNLDVSRRILELLGKPLSLLQHVPDRKGHDFRYAANWEKLRRLGWEPKIDFSRGLEMTVAWYQSHRDWWEKIVASESFRSHVKQSY